MASRKAFEQALRTAKMRERVTNQLVTVDELRGIDHLLYCAYKARNDELPATRPRDGEDRGHVNWLRGHLRDADPAKVVYIPPNTTRALLLNPFSVAQLNDHSPLERLLPRLVYSKDERDGVVQLGMLLEESFADKAEEFFDYGIAWLELYGEALDLLSKVSQLLSLSDDFLESHPPADEIRPFVVSFYEVRHNLTMTAHYKTDAMPPHYRGPCRLAALVNRIVRQRQPLATDEAVPAARLAEVTKGFAIVAEYIATYRKFFKLKHKAATT